MIITLKTQKYFGGSRARERLEELFNLTAKVH